MITVVTTAPASKLIESLYVNVRPDMPVNCVKFNRIIAQIIHVKVVNVKVRQMVFCVNVHQESLVDGAICDHVIIYRVMKMHSVSICRC